MAVPKLRFKEFDANWSLSSLGKMTTYFKGYAFKSESYKDSGIRVIRVSDLGRESIKTDNNSIYIDANEASAYENWIIKKDDIIITTVGSKPHLVDSAVGRPIYVKNNNEGLLNQNLLVLRPLDETVDSYFIYAQLLDKKYLTHIELIQRGNANQSNITVKDLQDFETYLTSKEEQTKIATFISAVDEKISQLTQEHELLSQYKQGMMQKLFSQQIRFKADDGSEFGEWEKAKTGDITETIFGYPFDSKEMVEDNNGIPLMRGINIGERHIRHSHELDRFFLKNTSKLKKYFVKVNDIVLSMDGSKVGRNSAFVTEKDAGSLLVQRVCILREKENTNIQYVYQWVISKEFHRYVDQVKTSSGIPHISGKQIQDYEIGYPCLEEQTKIANFLSAIDQKIEVVAQQIEQAKQWKKGLLQQMFV